jgi:hypothetical protein
MFKDVMKDMYAPSVWQRMDGVNGNAHYRFVRRVVQQLGIIRFPQCGREMLCAELVGTFSAEFISSVSGFKFCPNAPTMTFYLPTRLQLRGVYKLPEFITKKSGEIARDVFH